MGVFLTEAEAVEMMLNAGVKPLTSYPGTKVGWKSVCLTCQNIVSPRLGNIRSGQNACGYCSGVRVNVNNAIKLFESINLKPLTDYPGAQKPWLSKCLQCGSEVAPSYSSVQQGNGGCVYCAGNRITIDQVMDSMKDAGYEPLEPYVSSGKRWKCKCLSCGKISTPRYNDVQQGNRCGFCASSGFDLDHPAIVYLITKNELCSHKIGVTNIFENKENSRMMKHRLNGWLTFKTIEFSTGQSAVQVENQVIDWLRNEKGLKRFLTAEQMPQGGWTETVDASEIDLPTIWAKVEELSKVKK